MSPVLNGSSVIQHFKHSNALEIRDRITFDFYTALPHMQEEIDNKLTINLIICACFAYLQSLLHIPVVFFVFLYWGTLTAWDERTQSVVMIQFIQYSNRQCIQGNTVTNIFGHLIIHDKMLRSGITRNTLQLSEMRTPRHSI